MATLGRWTGTTTSLIPTTSWAAPNALFPTQARNDGTAYGWASTTSTLTLPSSDLADGYLVIGRFEYTDTSNGRFSPNGRFQQTGGTGNFVNGQSGGFNRNNNNPISYVTCWGFVDNPSASATLQFQWRRQSDAPTGGTTKASLDVIPLYYSNHGLYTSASNSVYGGTTPNVVTLSTTVDESDTAAIQRATNVVTVKGNSKRYLILSSQWYQGYGESGTTRTQRIQGFDIDGSQELAAQGYSYHRQGSADGTGSTPMDIIETVTADRTIELTCYRGDGVSNNQGGADVDSATSTLTAVQGLVVLELNDSAEVHRSHNTGTTTFTTAADFPVTPVAGIDIQDTASFTRSTDDFVNVEDDMDAFVWMNLWGASTTVTSSERGQHEANITVNGTEDANVFHGNYGPRGNQSSEDTFAFGAQPKGFIALTSGDDIGGSSTDTGGDAEHPVRTNVGTVGFGAINLDTMEAAGAAVTATADVDIPTITASGVAAVRRKATAAVSIAALTVAANAIIWPTVYLNTTESTSGADIMTVTDVNEAGTSITFTDPAGGKTGSLYLGVENARDEIAWIAVTVTATTKTASGDVDIPEITSTSTIELRHTSTGTPSIAAITSSGNAQIVKIASGTPDLLELTAAGAAQIVKLATSGVSTPEITASGSAQIVKTASSAVSIDTLTASATAELRHIATSTVSTPEIIASGTTQIVGAVVASGDVSIDALTAAGAAQVVKLATSAVSIPEITVSAAAQLRHVATSAVSTPEIIGSGAAQVAKTASSAVSIPEITVSAAAQIVKLATSAVSIDSPTASGAAQIVKTASGAVSLPEITASGTSVVTHFANAAVDIPTITSSGLTTVGGIIAASASVSIDEITVTAAVQMRRSASGTPSVPEVTASGVTQTAKLASGTPSLAEITASGTATTTTTAVTRRGGGTWQMLTFYDRYHEEHLQREREKQQAREDIKAIQDETDAEIARLLHKQLEYEARTKEIESLEALVKASYSAEQQKRGSAYNEAVGAAYAKANDVGTFAALELFEREMERMLEDEEFLILALMTLE